MPDSAVKRGMLEFKIDRTKAYVIHKGRLPKDAGELYEWLNEFTEITQRHLDLIEQAYKEHLAICVRPVIITKDGLPVLPQKPD